MIKFIKGIVLGLVIGSVIGSWAGFNKGRDAPLFSNPFKDHTLADELKDNAGALYDDTKKSLRKSLE